MVLKLIVVSSLFIAASPPVNVTVIEATNITLTLEWQPPLTPNGIIFAYMVGRYINCFHSILAHLMWSN